MSSKHVTDCIDTFCTGDCVTPSAEISSLRAKLDIAVKALEKITTGKTRAGTTSWEACRAKEALAQIPARPEGEKK